MNGDELGRHSVAGRTGRSPSLEVRIKGNASTSLLTLYVLLPETENTKFIAPLPWASGYLQHQLAWEQEQVTAQLGALALSAQAGCGWKPRSLPYLAASGISCVGAALPEVVGTDTHR